MSDYHDEHDPRRERGRHDENERPDGERLDRDHRHARPARGDSDGDPADDDMDDEVPERDRGRFKKGRCYNRYGRRGSPATQAQRHAEKNESLDEAVIRLLRREVTITENGEQKRVTMLNALAAKTVRDIIEAPVKQRMELLFSRRSHLRDLVNAASEAEDRSDWPTELEEEYRVVEGLYDLDRLAVQDEERDRRYRDYLAWRDELERLGDRRMVSLSRQECYQLYLDERDGRARR